MTVLNDANKVYLGNTLVNKVYLGTEQVFPKPGPWTPANLGSNLLVWYDGLVANSIVIGGAGVTQWTDQSSYHHNATQTTDALKPTTYPGAVSFAGSQFLNTTNFPVIYDYCLIGYLQWGGNYRIAMWGGNGAGLMVDPGNSIGTWSYSGFRQAGGLSWPGNSTNLIYGSIHNTANSQVSLNGGALQNTGVPVETSQIISICRNDYGQPFGDLFEIILVPYGSPVDTKYKLEGYIAWKWGIQNALPANHPYKAAPP